MRDEDLIDTAPVIMNERTDVVFENVDLGINERGEITLTPEKPMRRPTLFMVDKGSEIQVEAVFHGRSEIRCLSCLPIYVFRFGRQLEVTATRDEPIKIVLVNNGPEPTSVGASLVGSPAEHETRYHLRREDLED